MNRLILAHIAPLVVVANVGAQRAPIVDARWFGPENGLSNRHITAVMRDDLGFVWVGTVSGLDRFDGHGFRNWSIADGLSCGRIDAMRRDVGGRIWVFTYDTDGGMASIDVVHPRSGSVMPLAATAQTSPVPIAELTRPAPQVADGTILLGAQRPARYLTHGRNEQWRVVQLDGERFEPFGVDRGGGVIGMLTQQGGSSRIVLADSAGAIRVLQELPAGCTAEPLVSGRTSAGALYRTKERTGRTRYFDTFSELFPEIREPLDEKSRHGEDPVRKPLHITPLGHGLKAIDTRIIDDAGRTVFDIERIRSEVVGRVKDVLVDQAGDLWMGTEFGLCHVVLREDAFRRILHDPLVKGGSGALCRGMVWHEGTLYVSTEWSGAHAIKLEDGSPRAISRPEPQYLFATHVAPDGTWWRGGREVLVREDKNGKQEHVAVPGTTWSILTLPDGVLLLGGEAGVHRFDPRNGNVRRWGDAKHPELAQAHVLQLDAHAGGVLAATSKGLYLLDNDGTVRERYHARAAGRLQLPYEDLHHCLVDEDGAFWLSTRGAGLVRFEPRTGGYQQYTMRNGFPNNMVYAAYPDAFGQLWLPTDGGLVRFDKGTRQGAVFTTANGLAHDEFNRLAHTRAPDGRLFFGGLNGITEVDPARFQPAPGQPKGTLVFTGLMRYSADQGGMVDHTPEMLASNRVTLGPGDKGIEVSFALLSFRDASRILYGWRMAGVEDDWTYQRTPSIRLERIPHGEHVLEIKARNAQGQWCDQPLTLAIEVPAPWHNSRLTWVGIGAAGVLLLLIVGRSIMLQPARRRSPHPGHVPLPA